MKGAPPIFCDACARPQRETDGWLLLTHDTDPPSVGILLWGERSLSEDDEGCAHCCGEPVCLFRLTMRYLLTGSFDAPPVQKQNPRPREGASK